MDFSDATICCNILEWDYKAAFSVGHFDIIWASPPCNTFSKMRLSNVGRYGVTMETIQQDISLIGLPILRRTEEIIDYFKPSLYFIENPQTGRMKDYIDRPYYDVTSTNRIVFFAEKIIYKKSLFCTLLFFRGAFLG